MDTSVRTLNNAVEDLVAYIDDDARRSLRDALLGSMTPDELDSLADAMANHRGRPSPGGYDARELLAKALHAVEIQKSIADWVASEFIRESQPTRPSVPDRSNIDKLPAALHPSTSIAIRATAASLRYRLIDIPHHHRGLFPGYRIPFHLATDIGTYEVKVTSAVGNPPAGHPSAGRFIKSVERGGLDDWFQRHNFLKSGDILTISVLEPMHRYKLDVG